MYGLILENGTIKAVIIDDENRHMLLRGLNCKTTFDTLEDAEKFIDKLYIVKQ